jgi:hypothetical protein
VLNDWMDSYRRSLHRYGETYRTLAESVSFTIPPGVPHTIHNAIEAARQVCVAGYQPVFLHHEDAPPYFWLGADAERV